MPERRPLRVFSAVLQRPEQCRHCEEVCDDKEDTAEKIMQFKADGDTVLLLTWDPGKVFGLADSVVAEMIKELPLWAPRVFYTWYF